MLFSSDPKATLSISVAKIFSLKDIGNSLLSTIDNFKSSALVE